MRSIEFNIRKIIIQVNSLGPQEIPKRTRKVIKINSRAKQRNIWKRIKKKGNYRFYIKNMGNK